MAVAELKVKDQVQSKEKSLFHESMIRLARNRLAMGSLLFITILMIVAGFPSTFAPADPIRQDLAANSAVPQWLFNILPQGTQNFAKVNNQYPLGADDLGRDLMSRAIHGANVSLKVAVVSSLISLAIGLVYGCVAGYAGGWIDNLMMRIIDFLYGFPFLIVVILMQAFFKAKARSATDSAFWENMIALNDSMGGLFFMFIAISLVSWIGMARLARGQILSYKKKEFVEAAHALGASDSRIIFRHLLPNILGPLIVAETMAIPGYIFTESFLSFIGLGVDPPTASWGIMISEGVKILRTFPNQVMVPGIALSLTTLAFNFLGDGLRDAFDPRQKNN